MVDNSPKAIYNFLWKIFGFYFFWLISDSYLSHELAFYSRLWSFFYHIFLKALQFTSIEVLQIMGYDLVHGYNSLAIVGSYGVIIGNPCVGFGLTYGFVALIISYPGPLKAKLWFIPLGAAVILAVNVARVVSIAKQTYTIGGFVQMEQHDLFNNIIYILIFLLWVVWVQLIVNRHNKKKQLAA